MKKSMLLAAASLLAASLFAQEDEAETSSFGHRVYLDPVVCISFQRGAFYGARLGAEYLCPGLPYALLEGRAFLPFQVKPDLGMGVGRLRLGYAFGSEDSVAVAPYVGAEGTALARLKKFSPVGSNACGSLGMLLKAALNPWVDLGLDLQARYTGIVIDRKVYTAPPNGETLGGKISIPFALHSPHWQIAFEPAIAFSGGGKTKSEGEALVSAGCSF